jgi:hypothetical protein
MNLKDIDNSLDTVDSIGTKTAKILKKHWWLILLTVLGLSYFGYIQLTPPDLNLNGDKKENVVSNSTAKKETIVKPETITVVQPIVIQNKPVETVKNTNTNSSNKIKKETPKEENKEESSEGELKKKAKKKLKGFLEDEANKVLDEK